jgi:UDP-N-acetylglucosamine pyrophosphorylase
MNASELAVVIMAAGKGTRMKNPEMAKVMYPIAGRPMIEYVVDLALRLRASRTVVVVGWQKQSVIDHLSRTFSSVTCVEQTPQLGTGHAVMQAEEALVGFAGNVLVLSGDVPLLSYRTTAALLQGHESARATATVLTALIDTPSGYGRILRDGTDHVVGIVEEKDATAEQKQIREINSGIYVFDRGALFEGLKHITPANAQKEYYLTDVFHYFWRNHLPVRAVPADEPAEVRGINTIEQLEEAQEVLRGRAL